VRRWRLSEAGRESPRIVSVVLDDGDGDPQATEMRPAQDFIIVERALAVELAEIVEELAAEPLDDPRVVALIARARGVLATP
jgi:hypothetical protein